MKDGITVKIEVRLNDDIKFKDEVKFFTDDWAEVERRLKKKEGYFDIWCRSVAVRLPREEKK